VRVDCFQNASNMLPTLVFRAEDKLRNYMLVQKPKGVAFIAIIVNGLIVVRINCHLRRRLPQSEKDTEMLLLFLANKILATGENKFA